MVLRIEDYEALLEFLENLEDIRAFDEAMKDPEAPIPWEEAKRQLHVSS